MTFCGFLLFDCPLKSSTRSTVQSLIDNRYRVKIITGDNPYTACEIAKQCGIIPASSEVLVLASSPVQLLRAPGVTCRSLYWENLASQTLCQTFVADPAALAALQARFVLVLNGFCSFAFLDAQARSSSTSPPFSKRSRPS